MAPLPVCHPLEDGILRFIYLKEAFMEEAGVKVVPYITGYLSKGDPKKPRNRMSHLPSLGRHAVENIRETQSWPFPRTVKRSSELSVLCAGQRSPSETAEMEATVIRA